MRFPLSLSARPLSLPLSQKVAPVQGCGQGSSGRTTLGSLHHPDGQLVFTYNHLVVPFLGQAFLFLTAVGPQIPGSRVPKPWRAGSRSRPSGSLPSCPHPLPGSGALGSRHPLLPCRPGGKRPGVKLSGRKGLDFLVSCLSPPTASRPCTENRRSWCVCCGSPSEELAAAPGQSGSRAWASCL